MKRRQFLQAGIIGGAALTAGGAWVAWRDRNRIDDPAALPRNADGAAAADAMQQRIHRVLAAIAPALLAGALSVDPGARATSLARVTQDVRRLIATFTPPVRTEVHQLFSLLDMGVTRWALTGIADLSTASTPEVGAFLERWRHSRFAMLRSGYHALHDLVLGTWYASDVTWADVGYPGPPKLL